MRRSVDLVPRITGHDPALRRLALERVQVFRLPRQQTDDGHAVEYPARRAFTDELGEIGAEGHVEDGFRLGCRQRLHGRSGVDLALRRPLLADELDIRPLRLQELLEHRDRRLAVFIIRRHRGPALGGQGRRLFHQHGGLHIGRGTQAEGVAVALLPRDGVGQRFRRDEHLLAAERIIADRQPDMAEIGAGEGTWSVSPAQGCPAGLISLMRRRAGG